MRDESRHFGCYLSKILTWQPKTDRDRERAARERAKRVINNYVIFLIVVAVTHSLSHCLRKTTKSGQKNTKFFL